MVLCLVFPASSVYGHGTGIDTISSIDIQGKEISITVEMPMYLENDQEQITITAIEKETKENAKNVTFLIGLFHENELIFRNYFFTEDGILSIKVTPTQEGEIRNVTFFAFSLVSFSITVIVICSWSFSKYIGISTEIEISFPWISIEEIVSIPNPCP